MFFYTNGKFICKRHNVYTVLFTNIERYYGCKCNRIPKLLYLLPLIAHIFQAIYCLRYLPMTQYRDFFQSLARQVYLYKIKWIQSGADTKSDWSKFWQVSLLHFTSIYPNRYVWAD